MSRRDPSTRSARRTSFRRVLSLAVSSLALSCAPGFTSGSKVQSLRVLAVQKDKPYAKPGDSVKLDMLYDDGPKDPNVPMDPKVPPRPIQITWYPGCENPAGDLYADCFTGDALTGFIKSLATPLSGPEITFQISKDIISSRPPPTNKKQPPYGLAYVFFVACAGTVKPNLNAGQNEFPIQCVSNTGEVLGADDFVVGYTSVYAYADFQNQNPKLASPYFMIDGKETTKDEVAKDEAANALCADAACIPLGPGTSGSPASTDAGSPDAADASPFDAGFVKDAGTTFVDGGHDAGFGIIDGGGSDGGKPDAGPSNVVTYASLPACTTASEKDCPDHGITLLLDPATAVEHDVVQEKLSGGTVYEQAWIDYYVDNGSVTNEVKLLGDATKGYIDDHATNLHAPQISSANAADFPLSFHVWAVAHDSRGGVSWARVLINSYAPKASPSAQP